MTRFTMRCKIHPQSGRTLLAVLGLGALGIGAVVTALPVYLRSQEKAQQAASLQNLRQWGIALNLYLSENDSQLPDVGSAPISADQTTAWYNALPLYLGQKPLAALSPAELPRPGQKSLWMEPSRKYQSLEIPQGAAYFNYGMNPQLAGTPRVRSLDAPSQIWFLAPTQGSEPAATTETRVYRWSNFRNQTPCAPIGFADGHIELIAAPLNPAPL